MFHQTNTYFCAERRLRSNERVVHFQHDGILPSESRFRRICYWSVSHLDYCIILPSESLFKRPFFDEMIIDWPPVTSNSVQSSSKRLTIKSSGASQKQYVKSLTVNGENIDTPILVHEQIVNGGEIVFEMSDEIQDWGNNPDVLKSLKD